MCDDERMVFSNLEKVDRVAERVLRGEKRGPKLQDGIRKKKIYRTWLNQPPPYRVGVDGFTYSNIPRTFDKIDPKMYLPEAYDLVKLVLECQRVIPGWHDGSNWVSHRLKGRVVVWWKRDLYAY